MTTESSSDDKSIGCSKVGCGAIASVFALMLTVVGLYHYFDDSPTPEEILAAEAEARGFTVLQVDFPFRGALVDVSFGRCFGTIEGDTEGDLKQLIINPARGRVPQTVVIDEPRAYVDELETNPAFKACFD